MAAVKVGTDLLGDVNSRLVEYRDIRTAVRADATAVAAVGAVAKQVLERADEAINAADRATASANQVGASVAAASESATAAFNSAHTATTASQEASGYVEQIEGISGTVSGYLEDAIEAKEAAEYWAGQAQEIAGGRAVDVTFTVTEDILSTNVQDAIEEVDTGWRSAFGSLGSMSAEDASDYYTKTDIDNMGGGDIGPHTHGMSDITGLTDALSGKADSSALFSGDYDDLDNKPSIPAAQVNADWNADAGVAEILNKPALFSGDYGDLSNKPSLFSGSYDDLSEKPTLGGAASKEVGTTSGTVAAGDHGHGISDITGLSDALGGKADKNELFSGSYSDLTDKPSIPDAQVNADWNASSGLAEILNKPALFSGAYADLSGKPALFDGAYGSLSGRPTLGDAAAKNTGTTAGTVAAGNDSRITGAAQKSANLNDLADKAGAFTNIKQAASDSATGVVELATASEIRSGAAGALAVTPAGVNGALAAVTPSGASNWTPDWSAFAVADWNVTANRTLSNPTNVIPGTTRYAFIRGSSGTNRTITFGSNFKGDLPTLNDVSNAKWYLLSLVAYSATHIVVTAVEASP